MSSPGVDLVPSGRSNRRRILQLAGVIVVGLIYVCGGLVWRQSIQSAELTNQHERQIRYAIILPGSRGRIYDRNGFELVDNRVKWSVTVDLGKLRPHLIREQRRLIALERATWKQPTAYRPDLETIRTQARINVIQAQLDRVNRALTTPTRRADFRVNAVHLERHLRDRRSTPFAAIEDLELGEPRSGERIARFFEQLPPDDILAARSEVVRTYPHGTLACHLLGHVRPADTHNPDELVALRRDLVAEFNLGTSSFSVWPSSRGIMGIEASFNDVLAGGYGWRVIERSISGEQRKLVKAQEPRKGANVNLSIDLIIQRAAERALSASTDPNIPVLPGSAAMVDVRTGEVLALVSTPGFDPNLMTGRISQATYDEIGSEGGWFSRATQGLYPPGSTFKVITAIAGLRTGDVRHNEVINCGPYLMVGGREFPEHIEGGYGPTDLEKMLIVSCNVWNYIVGLRTGIEALAAESRRFGLSTRLLISPEDGRAEYNETVRGLVPDAKYKRERGMGAWTSGDTANTSIGQGYLLVTPLHMAAVMASIARNETRTDLTLIKTPHHEGGHRDSEPLGLTPSQRRALLDGLVRCVEEGTGGPMRIAGLSIAAKTGTSEYYKDGKKAHLAWAIGFAPAERPEVAFSVCIEGEDMTSWGGATAGPVARAMLQAWLRQTRPELAEAAGNR